jgi:hypothetical protein
VKEAQLPINNLVEAEEEEEDKKENIIMTEIEKDKEKKGPSREVVERGQLSKRSTGTPTTENSTRKILISILQFLKKRNLAWMVTNSKCTYSKTKTTNNSLIPILK